MNISYTTKITFYTISLLAMDSHLPELISVLSLNVFILIICKHIGNALSFKVDLFYNSF